jgi:hypothetical protein
MHVLASLKPASLVFRLPQTSPKAKTMPRLKITRFAAQAECHYQATQQGNARTANRAYAQIVRAKDSLVAGGHLAALVPLLCHEHAAVRLWAARYLLFCPPFAQQTEAVLTTIAAHGAGILIADAKQTLTQWRKGNLTLGD